MITPLCLVVDSREQAPWDPVLKRDGRRHILPVVRRGLAVGDYSLSGYEAEIAVERKSLQDWIGTLFGCTRLADGERAWSWERFKREIGRANGCERPGDKPAFSALRRFSVIVEGSREQVYAHEYRSGVEPASVIGRSDSLWVDHGVAVTWAGSRDEAQRLALWSLVRWWEARQLAPVAEGGSGSSAEEVRAHIRTLREPKVVPAPAPNTRVPPGFVAVHPDSSAALGLARGRDRKKAPAGARRGP